MKAVVVTDFATDPTLTDLPVPEPGPGELLIRLYAAGLNPFDWKVADGALRDVVPHAFPLVMGSDGAGVVERTGPGVTRFRPGDRVYGQFMRLEQGLGSYAEYTLAAEDSAIAVFLDTLAFTLAAALPTAGVTAIQTVETAGLRAGHTVLINGAGGGVGQSAVQFATQAGARVLATGTPDLAPHLRALGAATVIDHTAAPVHDQVTPGSVDAIVDLVTPAGGDADALAGLLRPGGILISTNYALDVDALAARDIVGVNFGNRPTPEVLTTLAELADTGKLRVHIDVEVPLPAAPAALARSRAGQARGKTVITLVTPPG
jgi:NADPH:quinone reductase-like Zn-dependent oxidoreductase